MAKIKVGIHTLTNEPEYLTEWVNHYRNYGFDHFFVYLDSSIVSEPNIDYSNTDYLTYKVWDCKNSPQGQMRAQEDCCKNNQDYDYILMIDSDEYLMTKNNMNIKQVIENLYYIHGDFDALALYWRFYGSNPSFLDRQPIENYRQWHPNNHIKSLVNPKKVIRFNDPHFATLLPNTKYIDELGRKVTSPIGNHTSENIWIKHTYTRSKSEWEKKVNRKGWYEFYGRKMEEFENYNKSCVNSD